MILLHELHEVIGASEDDFEAAYRDDFLGALGGTDDARLLYYLHHAHGTGVSYNVVTLTALRDAAAWESLAGRIHAGDLRDWACSAGQLEQYIERSGAHYAVEMRENAAKGGSILEVLASYRTLFGAGLRREILLWQKVVQPKALTPLISREVPEQYKRPGTWMHDALGVRDRWESKLLRTALPSEGASPALKAVGAISREQGVPLTD